MLPANFDEDLDLVRNFAPSWFAAVMGTGILAIDSLLYSQYLPFLGFVAVFLFYLNTVLFFLLLIPWTLRWIKHPKMALSDLYHPVVSNFYATIAIAMLVLSANFTIIGQNLFVGQLFWFAGSALTIVFGIASPFIMFKGDSVAMDHINPAWFIPPVGLIVIPIPGSLIIGQCSGLLREFVLFINYFGWGAGFFIYLSLAAICMHRFILHRPLPNVLAPTIWINLGPIGAGTVALINLVNNSAFITIKQPFFVFGLIFWGFGIWWLLIAIVMTLHYVRTVKIPYALSWWAFTFPLGAYVAASHNVAALFDLSIVDGIGLACYGLLVFFWSVTFIKTCVAFNCFLRVKVKKFR